MVCELCNQPLKEEDSVFQGKMVCASCYDQEGQRSMKQDSVPGDHPAMRSRPPKYMLPQSEWAKFGY